MCGCALAQAVSRWLPTVAARVRARVWSCGICSEQSGAGAGFLRVLRFPLPIFIPPIAPQSSSSIIWGLYNRPEVAAVPSGLSPTPLKIKKIKNLDCVMSNGVMRDLLINWKGFGRMWPCSTFPQIASNDWGKPWNTRIRRAAIPGDIPKMHFPNICLFVMRGRESLPLIDMLPFASVLRSIGNGGRHTASQRTSSVGSMKRELVFAHKLVCRKYGGW
jgi:hypothetical protein